MFVKPGDAHVSLTTAQLSKPMWTFLAAASQSLGGRALVVP
jgi:hypothetical protein